MSKTKVKTSIIKVIGNTLNRKGILYKVLIPYCAFTILILILFSLLVEMLMTNHTKKEVQNFSNQILEQVYNTSDILLEHNFSYFFDLYYDDPQMKEYLYSSKMDPNDYPSVINYLVNCAKRDIVTHSIFLYNEQLGIIFSSNSGAYDIDGFYDQDIINYIRNGAEESKFIPREMKWKTGSVQEKSNVISYIFYDDSSVTGKRMALVVNIDQEKFQKLIGKNLDRSSVVTEVISPTGRLMSGGTDKIGETLNEEYIKEIIHSNNEKDAIEFKDSKSKYYISWRHSELFGWIYVGKVNYDDLLFDFHRYNSIIIISSIIFIFLGLILSIIFSKKIYIPIKGLINNVELDGIDKEDYRNEYELLNAVMEGMEDNTNKLKSNMYRYKLVKKNEILSEILFGDQVFEISNGMDFTEYGLSLQGPVFCVVRFSFNHFDSLKAVYSQTDMNLFCFAVINILEEYLLGKGYRAYGLKDGEDAICMFLQLDEEYEQGRDYLTERFQDYNKTVIQKMLYDAKCELERQLKLEFTFTVTVGRSLRNLKEVHRSYLDTKYASVYRLIRGTQLVILFTEHMEYYESGIPYPLDEEKKILSYIKLFKEEEITTSVEEFFTAIGKMSPNETRWAVNQLTLSILHLVMTLNYKNKDESPVDWKEWTGKINETDTREEMKVVLLHFLKNLSGEQDNGNLVKSNIAKDMRKYIDEHYQEDTFSINELAVHAGYSTNYVRLIFKNEYGISVSNYIQNKRIEKAKELLLTSDYTCKEIAGMVGYIDNRYFYVVFKRMTGETADNFRRKEED